MAPVDDDAKSGSITTLGILIGSFLVYRLADTIADPDLWGHVAFGAQILNTRRIVQADVYSYTTLGAPWTNHEWLIAVVFAALFDTFGPSGLIALKLAVILAICGVLYGHFCRCGLTRVQALVFLIVLVFAMTPWTRTVRAQLATYVLFFFTVLVLHRTSSGGLWPLWTLPLIFFVWANLHGGFLAGLGVLLVWAFIRVITLWLRREPCRTHATATIVGAVVVSFVATCLNPFGVELLTFLHRTALGARPDISEWQPLALSQQWGVLYLLLAVPAILALIWSRREWVPALLAVLLTVMAMPFQASRHVPLALLTIAVVAAEHIADALSRLAPATPGNAPPVPKAATLAIRAAGLGLAGLLLVLSAPRFSCIALGPASGTRPVRAVALLKQSGITANMAVDFDWGTYVLAQLGPAIKVSIDGRRETVYDENMRAQNIRFRFGLGEWDTLLTKYDTHLALVSKETPAYNLMKQRPGWKLLYEDPLSALLGREGLPQVAAIERTPVPSVPYDGTGLCFP